MSAKLSRACTAAALTAFLVVGAGGVGPAFAEDSPAPVNADQDGNPIPQAPADADVTVNSDGSSMHPDGCPPDPGFRFHNVKSTFVGDKSKTVYGQSGVTLSVSVAKGHTWTGTISYAVKLSESILVSSAEETISGSISYAKTTTVTLGGSWKVPASKRDGWLALGSKGYSFKWERGSTNGGCKWIVSNHGTAKLPALSPYIAHS
ncbi:hypothetical protein LXH13_20305 [Streptomyces spinosirectus]|jgi:hypothetical protein|uniref:hypothetical protein n=1 Tax=Streptomyces TaxID=1883 RepID=UPI000D45D71C|nr:MULTISPECIES: hypothetical protein [Streptomyces]MBY8342951.1 hypothetical protein [Streptomyces plumbidurans]PTM95670.1 hypothetical protein C7821_105193 [Streptomyces sp. VMFN-G11Ma]UIR19247.1 hypothetical protein LXH13_20305 [Streptomyces spinosirectus]